ncbi:hypothetical protein SAMN05660909_02283 [Chitinophaga terrae (ex Kim and Jung 2007)]|uniref:Uncharacterized protein n=1 Tax=Chitinophaga terrae (ex Kim and Jung 2007) TaxID=408074 RepID=A0A1H4BTJ9_9BACT|nr:hypothetical protein [Chitinophaga terrae (ex Kim and Jung 2007)]GEP89772.1 hypothetical protein CTE07_14170 [Chitinophaga terrae (ex Kim and Jung 2007)]SEA51506.1 hypothetical protein SAMN05660909_02283 [Chitinophaga terrae (ex Kim and Jung 2007)]
MFSFDPQQLDLWSLYSKIAYYYPVGLSVQDTLYNSYPGFVEGKEIIMKNFGDADAFREWEEIGKMLANKLNLQYEGTTYGQVPGYSFSLDLNPPIIHGSYEILKKLHISISVLGEYFTIWGADGTVFRDGIKQYHSINIITVSPYNEFQHAFKVSYDYIQQRFPGYRFVPHAIYNMQIPGLSIDRSEDPEYRPGLIYNAIFNSLLTGNEPARGDRAYKIEQWNK